MSSDAISLAEDLARTLSGEKDHVDVGRLKADMRVCADHYGLTPAECRQIWGVALGDMVAAAECFDRTAALILGPCRYINERIQDSIALERLEKPEGSFRTQNEVGERAAERYRLALAQRRAGRNSTKTKRR